MSTLDMMMTTSTPTGRTLLWPLKLLLLLFLTPELVYALATPSEGTESIKNGTETQRRHLAAQTRIIGGSAVTASAADRWPSFAEWYGEACGGVLVHDDLVLTAGHCLQNYRGGSIASLYFANHGRKKGHLRRAVQAVYHPNYNEDVSTRDWDFLLLKLDGSALVDGTQEPTGAQVIPINKDPNIPGDGDKVWAMGHGSVDEDVNRMVSQFNEVQMEAQDGNVCRSQYGFYYNHDYMFCSGVEGGGKDTCQGDSGGPIIHDATRSLIGIVSFGTGCGRPNKFGVNSRVSAAADWIEEQMCTLSNFPKCSDGPKPPTGSPPTAPPPTPAPTNPPTEPPLGSLSIAFRFDQYPEEIAWTFGDTTGSFFHFQPYGSNLAPGDATSQRFDNLQPSSQFVLRVSDLVGDGICCTFSVGTIVIIDHSNGDSILWSSQGEFGRYMEMEFAIDAVTGHASIVRESNEYQPSSWPALEELLQPTDTESWPGDLPTGNSFSVTVNVNTDEYPEESKWDLLYRPDDSVEGWMFVDSWDGTDTPSQTLASKEVSNLQPGWHRLVVYDSEGDGNCCMFGNGFVSVTGPLAPLGGGKGLIWGNDGNFWSTDEVLFYIDGSGYVSLVETSED